MAANLSLTVTAGIDCPKIAGIRKLYFIKTEDIAEIVLGTTAHDITNIVFDTAGEGFGEIGFKRGEAEVTETFERMNEVTVNFSLPSPTKEQRFQLQKIKDACKVYAVAELYDRNELLFIGYDAVAREEGFLTHQTAEYSTGRAKDDDNFMSPTLVAEQGEYVRILSEISGATATTTEAIIAELLAATNV